MNNQFLFDTHWIIKMEPQSYFRLAFTKVFGNMQLQQVGSLYTETEKHMYEFIRQYIMGLSEKNTILTNAVQEIKIVQEKLSLLQSNLKISFMYKYGAAIILQKISVESYIKIYVVFNSGWDVDSSITQFSTTLFPTPLKQFNIFYVGEIQNTKSLREQNQNFHKHLNEFISINNQLLKNKKQRIKNHHTPSWIAQACQKVLTKIREDRELMKEQFQLVSKGGTYDVGTHSGITKPDTVWSVAWAVVSFFTEDTDLIKILMTQYKIHLLKKYSQSVLDEMKKLDKIEKSKIGAFMHCLQDLRGEIEKLNGENNYYYSNEKACKQIKQLAEIIIKIDIPSSQRKFSLQQMSYYEEIENFEINMKQLAQQMPSRLNFSSHSMGSLSSSFKIKSNDVIGNLILSYQENSHIWIMAVQDTIFTMAFNELRQPQPFSNLSIDLVKANVNQLKYRDGILKYLFTLYSKEILKNSGYSMNLKCQAHSHLQLMKAIICVIGFQIFKRHNQDTIYDISEFKIPIDYKQLYKNFNSISYKPRKAIEVLYAYFEQHKDKKFLFNQGQGYQNYKIYSQRVARNSELIQIKHQEKQNKLKQLKTELTNKIIKYHKEYKDLQKSLAGQKNSPCSCYQESYTEYNPISRQNKTKTRKIQCARCKKVNLLNSELERKKYEQQIYIKTNLPLKDGLIHQFFYNIDSFMEGLMILILTVQHQIFSIDHQYQNPQNRLDIFSHFNLLVSGNTHRNQKFKLYDKKPQDVQNLIIYSDDDLLISWYGLSKPSIYYYEMSKTRSYGHDIILPEFIQNPTSPPNNLREHEVYAQINEKQSKQSIQQFLNSGSLRIGQYTQIPKCLESLLKRNIGIQQTFSNYEAKIYLIYRSLSSIQAVKPIQMNRQVAKNIWKQVNFCFHYFLQNYPKNFNSKDFDCLPFVGPLLSMMSRTVKDQIQNVDRLSYHFTDKPIDSSNIKTKIIIKKLMKKVFQQVDRIEKDIAEYPQKDGKYVNQQRFTQYFICFAGMCCFTELLLNQNQQSKKYQNLPVSFVKLIVTMKYKQHDEQKQGKNQSKHLQIINRFKMFKTQAIQNNIRVALNYFMTHLNQLTQVVKVVDSQIKGRVTWTKEAGEFLFRGVSQSRGTYLVDIKQGTVIRNGEAIMRVPQQFKNSDQYKAIFNDRDQQIFLSEQRNSFVTKRNFIYLFQGNLSIKNEAFFQFFHSQKQKPTINLIFKYYNQETNLLKRVQKWRLLSNQQLKSLRTFPLPQLFIKNYFAWYNVERSCIVFRYPQLQKIGDVCFVAFLDPDAGGNFSLKRKISHIHAISKQHYRSNLDKICKKDNKIFDKVILRTHKKSSPYQILSNIQSLKYIFELQSYQTTQNRKQRKFWLYRYDSTFIQDDFNGLIPQSFKNYRVSTRPFSNLYLPWTQKDKINCLVIQKFVHNQSTQQLHNFKVLVPKCPCDENGRKIIEKGLGNNASFYVYDIHDHFKDLRGINRQAQLHMISILAAINKNIRNFYTKLTPIEYAIKMMVTCFNNQPLETEQYNKINREQVEQLENVIGVASSQNNETLLLMGSALFKCTKQIRQLKDGVSSLHKDRPIDFQSESAKDIILKAMSRYNWKLRDGRLPYRERLPIEIINILGLKNIEENCYNRGQQRLWLKQNSLKFNLPQLSTRTYIQKYEKMIQEWKQINKQVIDSIDNQVMKKQKEQLDKLAFPIDIQNPEDNILLTEVMKQLKISHNTYHETKIILKSTSINRPTLLVKFKEILSKLQQAKLQIEKLINGVNLQNKDHIDVITGYRPVISPFDYVHILIDQTKKDEIFGKIFPSLEPNEQDKRSKQYLKELIKYWIHFTIKIDSCNRILIILKQDNQQIDKIALFRQCESPRDLIEKRIYWVCLQAQLKLQIWKSQFQTFKMLVENSRSGTVSQLNMGEGKTQVIIPMIALQLLYGELHNNKIMENLDHYEGKIIPRVNLMQSLLNESKINYFRFLSITSFNIPIVILPFSRKVDFNDTQKLEGVVRSLQYFKNKMLILVDQSSTHSLILKLREETKKSGGQRVFNKENTVFKNLNVFDIFDEVDAQLSPKKSFIYSIDKSNPLDEIDYRANIAMGLIESLCSLTNKFHKRSLITFDETWDDAQQSLQNGNFPLGYRLITKIFEKKEDKIEFRRKILEEYMEKGRLGDCVFLNNVQEHRLKKIYDYIVDQSKEQVIIPDKINEKARKVIYSLRGFLAYGVFEHCLSLRCRVNYGIPDQHRQKVKRLAVPYEAADIPSKKNDYAHPDVAILLTYMSYYNFGLTQKDANECVNALFYLTSDNNEARQQIFNDWYQSLSAYEQKKLKITSAQQLRLANNTGGQYASFSFSQMRRMYESFRMNRKFIAYWVKNCVFSKDMAQFELSMTSSSWDHAKVKSCLGFSGTKDNCRLLPTYVELINSQNKQIRGTDGKMLDMLIENVSQVIVIKEKGEEPIWKQFLNKLFELPREHKVASIIDAGAILASKSLKDDIVPWIAHQNQNFNRDRKFKGILFCSENTWKVYKLSNQQCIQRGTSIPDNETFVIFDQYRTRGADIKMDFDITAVLTLSSNITKDSLMQAVGRLRKIGRKQKVIIIITSEIMKQIEKDQPFNEKMSCTEKVKSILSWSCINSVKQNEKYLLPNTNLAKIHYKNSVEQRKPVIDKSDTSLATMYALPIIYKSITQQCQQKILQVRTLQLSKKYIESLQKLRQIYNIYGRKGKIKVQNFQQVCQRQTQIVKQQQQQNEIECIKLNPINQIDEIKQIKLALFYRFKFCQKLKESINFNKCTESLSNREQQNNQLMNSYFVLLNKDYICMITQREVYMLLMKGVPFYQCDFMDEITSDQYIARLSDLTIRDDFIKNNSLKKALVHCKFFNGYTIFKSEEEENIIINLFSQEEKKLDKIKYFLEKRKILHKYKNSTLEKVMKRLELMDDKFEEIQFKERRSSQEEDDNQQQYEEEDEQEQQEQDQEEYQQQQEEQEQEQGEEELAVQNRN